MDQTKLNLFIDGLMLLVISALAGFSLLMKYVLIPGRTAWTQYGVLVDITWLGLDRHAWGEVQLFLALLLLVLLVLRFILHWQMIGGLFAKLIPYVVLRKGVPPAFLLLAGLLVYFPALVTPEVNEVGSREDRCLGAPSGVKEFTATPPTATLRENKGDLNPAGQFDAREPRTKETSKSKSVGAKNLSDHWPRKPKYKTLYPLPKTITACCQPPSRWSP
jgi:hypothetical protein